MSVEIPKRSKLANIESVTSEDTQNNQPDSPIKSATKIQVRFDLNQTDSSAFRSKEDMGSGLITKENGVNGNSAD